MSLRHALLAVLTAEPMSGYDLIKYFDGTVAFLWYAPHSQIYPELRRMEREELLEVEVVARGTHAKKRIYSITELGMRELRRWADTVLPLQPDRDPYRLKAAYMEWSTPEAARRQLEEHLDHYQLWLQRWRQLLAGIEARQVPLLQRRLEKFPEHEHQAIVAYKRFAFEGEIARAQTEIAWAKKGLNLIEELKEFRVADERESEDGAE